MRFAFFSFRWVYPAVLILPIAAAYPAEPANSLTRTFDPVVTQGENLRPLWGRRIDALRLYAYRDSKWQPIPYQIDKVDVDGAYLIALNSVPEQVREETGMDRQSRQMKRQTRITLFENQREELQGQVDRQQLSLETFKELERTAYFEEVESELDYNDELAFLAKDAGDRAPVYTWLSDQSIELEIHDPLDGGRAWVYLFAFTPESAPARSPIDYVAYDPEEDRIISDRLEIDFNKSKPMIIERLVGKPPGSDPLPDVLDRFKLRITIRPRVLLCLTMHFDEESTRAFTAGYKDGPVRIIRRSVFWVMIGGVKLPFAPKMVSYLTAYEHGLSSRAQYYIPVDLKWFLCKGSRLEAGLDLLQSAYGARIFSKDNPVGGMLLDGTMDQAEGQLISENQEWVAGFLPNRAALVSRMLYDDKMLDLGATLDLVYRDHNEPGEGRDDEPGEHFVGHAIDLKRFPAGAYKFGFQIYAVFDFKMNDVTQLLNLDDHPLTVHLSTP